MRRLALLGLMSIAALMAAVPDAEAQLRRRGEDTLTLNVRPRSFLDAGRVVPVGTYNRYAGVGQVQSYLNLPPWVNQRDRFGEGTLPDPITNGPFVGARNPFGPIDFVAPPGLAR